MKPNHIQHGFALPLTLALLTLLALLVAQQVRRSSIIALNAHARADELQRRWGAISAEVVLAKYLPHLDPLDQPRIVEVEIGTQKMVCRLFDEQSKANIRSASDHAKTKLLQKVGGMVPPLEARRNATSWSQVFPRMTADALEGEHGDGPLHRLTCWGDGRINLQTAAPEVIAAVVHPLLTPAEIEQILQFRQKHPPEELPRAINELALTSEKREALMTRIRFDSQCWSIWITCHDRFRNWHELFVIEQVQDGFRPMRYRW